MNKIPPPNMLERPLVAALEELGGKGHRIDVERVVARNLGIPRALAENPARPGATPATIRSCNTILSWAGTPRLVKTGSDQEKIARTWSFDRVSEPRTMEVTE